MAERYYFKDGAETKIPVADGDFYTDEMDAGYSTGNCAVEFFDADS